MCKVKVGVQYFENSIYFLIKIYIQMHVEDGFKKFFLRCFFKQFGDSIYLSAFQNHYKH